MREDKEREVRRLLKYNHLHISTMVVLEFRGGDVVS